MIIAPTLLNYSVDECILQFKKLSQYFNRFQIDIQDGKFVTNKTIELKDYFQTFSFEKDLELLSTYKDFLKIGFILVHYSLNPDFQKLKSLYPYFSFGI